MKKHLLSFGILLASLTSWSQNPGLVLSEIFPNPSGSDSPFEWIELKATSTIDFSVTPYTVVCNNSAATINGWVEGSTITYAFEINTGTVAQGDVVYVGGTSMAPTGTKLRAINTATTAGDGLGTANASGVVGNGGSNGDGIAVFNLPVASITNATVPVDALFYGSALGTAVLNAGADGYQLPINDLYAGGKLQSTSFIGPDPGSDQTISAAGFYNTNTNSWGNNRTWSVGSFNNNNASGVVLGTVNPPGSVSFSQISQVVTEGTTATITVNMTNANADSVAVLLAYSVYSDATETNDFTLSIDTLFIPGHTIGAQTFTCNALDDILAERTEKVILKLSPLFNVNIGANSFQIIYIKDNDYQAPVANNELKLNLLSSFSNGPEGANSSEIVAFDPSTDKLYIANSIGAKIDIVDLANPAAPVLLNSIDMSTYGGINSLTVHNGTVVAAIENSNPQANGTIVFFDGAGAFISQVTVGAMPDMVTFNNDYTKILVACEGEPKTDYSIDPEGTIGIIDLTPGISNVTNANVTLVNFQNFNGQENSLRGQGIRIFGPGSSAAQDFEPEYITISEDNSTAYVTLQENNALAVINIATATVSSIRPLGSMDYSNGNNGLDASDQTTGVLIGSAPIKGLFMPDAIAHAQIGGTEYLFTANEGDAREYTAYSEITRLSGANLDPTIIDQNILKSNQFLGRINVTKASGDTDNDGDIDEIHVFGTRSFTIWNAQTGALVFDSKDLLEQITASHPTLSGLFNASNSAGAATSKNRSDDKGPEPEGVATAFINGNHYLFVSLERVGGVMIFNIDNPVTPAYVGYYNNRTVATNGPDRGAEGIITIKKEDSPNGKDLVLLANEVSSTLSIFEINTCVDLAGATISYPTDSICAGDTVTLTIAGNPNSTVQWYKNNQMVPTATGNSLNVTEAGDYRVYVSNTTLACADTTVEETIAVLALPSLQAGADITICVGDTVQCIATTTGTPVWNNGVQNGTAFVPTLAGNYIVQVTDIYGCTNSDTLVMTIHDLPVVEAGNDLAICVGQATTFTASGATSYSWNLNVVNGQSFIPTASDTYIVTGTDVNGCKDVDTLVLTLNTLPIIELGDDTTVCQNHLPVILVGPSGMTAYAWNNGFGQAASTITQAGVYTLTVTGSNGCVKTDTIQVITDPCLGVDANSVATISVYPNPATNKIHIQGDVTQVHHVTIYTAAGQLVLQKTLLVGETDVDVRMLAKGNYVVHITTMQTTKQLKLQID